MISSRSSIKSSSEKNSNNNKIKFETIIIHNDRINNLQNKSEDKKSHSSVLNSESENSLSKNNKSSSNSEKKEKRSKNIDSSTQRKFLKHNREKKIERINSSKKSSSKSNVFVKVLHRVSSSIKNSIRSYEDSSYENKSNEEINEYCLICDEKLTKEEKIDNLIDCLHMFCDDCYFNYIKEKIDNNFIQGIKCPFKECETKLYENFIEKKLFRDIPLLDKYKKLQKKRQLMLNPKIQLCPFPDCDSYALKKGINNYVSCIKNKHKFCFNCLKNWHGNKKCDSSEDKSFKKWRDSLKVKRCPQCKYFIEKNEGCNHITCFNCKYEFCWLCLGKYSSGHYDFGRCSGLQNTECRICSIRLFNFLYQLLLVFLKSLLFAIGVPFISVFFIGYGIAEKINDSSDCMRIIVGIIACSAFLNFIMCAICLTSLIAILMLFYWPFQDLIFGLIDKF